MALTTDAYGNTIITFTEQPATLDELTAIIPQTDSAVILINLTTPLIGDYNEQRPDRNQKILPQAVHRTTNQPHLIIKNKSPCPELFDGRLYAAGTAITFNLNGDLYGLFHKDPTKKIITCFGGTSNHDEFDGHIPLFSATAHREVYEESCIAGMGLTLEQQRMFQVLSTQMATTLFGIPDINDNYMAFGYHCTDRDFELNRGFFYTLFDPANKVGDDYILRYTDHSETEYVLAMKLNTAHMPVKHISEYMPAIKTGINLPDRMSSIAIFCTYLTLNKLYDVPYEGFVIENKDSLVAVGMPPTIRGLVVF